MKKCSKCKKEKDESEFYKNWNSKDGLNSYCNKCIKEYNKKLYNENKVERIIKQKKYYDNNQENIKAYSKKYYIENKKDIINKVKKYAKNHKKNLKKYSKKYYIKNKYEDKYIYRRYKSDAKRRDIEFNLIFEDFLIFLNNTCFYCGDIFERMGVDRINNNKGYVLDNCVSCCSICNLTKNILNIQEWYEYLKQIILFRLQNKNKTIKRQRKNISIKSQFLNYKNNAKRKNIEFDISFEEFLNFENKPCNYCGTITESFIGIDRVNNNVGYLINNCVSCCKICNSGKKNNSLKIWEGWLNKIVKFNKWRFL